MDSGAASDAAVPIVTMDAVGSFFDSTAEETTLGLIEEDEDSEALVIFTSGSSGQAKGVRLSHRSVLANQHNLLLRSRRVLHQDLAEQPEMVTLVTVPLFHIGGLTSLVMHVITGGRIVFLRGRFDPEEVLDTIEREEVTSWGGVPTMARRVLESPTFPERNLSSLRSFPLGGAPIPSDLLQRLREQLPHDARGLAASWGLTESGGFLTHANATDLLERPGTSGRPYPVVEVKVANPDPNGTGELLVRSPTVMLGYVGEEDQVVDEDGWLHTGDLGRFEDDYIYITGRAKDIVIRGGENIACPHVESVLLRHPDVVEGAAFGVPHPDLGEELAASVFVRDGANITPEELRAHAARELAYFEIPTRWIILREPLPVLATGKVDKATLRSSHAQGMDS
jgi:long-chain acyl-CoA synthetase